MKRNSSGMRAGPRKRRRMADQRLTALRSRLHRYRLEKGYTYRRLADLVGGGVSYKTLWAFLSGQTYLNDTTAFKIETFLREVGRAA